MDWREVKQEILDQIDKNWLEEPEAMWKVRHGINVTGAGSFNQYLSTMMFVDVYTIAYGQHMFFMFLQMCDDPDISLDVLKKLTHNELAVGFDSMQFLAYVSTPEIKKFARDIDTVLCQLQTKEEYKELIGVYDRYINLIHYWHHCTFPWHIGLMYQYKGTEEIDKMQQLAHS